MKRLCALLLAALLLLSGCAAGRPDGSLPTLTVTFLDVGKADCILLEAEGRAAMIDAGNRATPRRSSPCSPQRASPRWTSSC